MAAFVLLTGWEQRLVDEGDIPKHVDYGLPSRQRCGDLQGLEGRRATKPPVANVR